MSNPCIRDVSKSLSAKRIVDKSNPCIRDVSKIGIKVNDIGNIPCRSDIQLSNGEYLEMKRIPIGTDSYDLSANAKFKNYEPE